MTTRERSVRAPVSMRILLVAGALALLLGTLLLQQLTESDDAQPSVPTLPATIKDIAGLKR